MFNKKTKINIQGWAFTGAITSAIFMLLLSLVNAFGIYTSATSEMMKWHMYYAPTVQGTILGMIESAILSYVVIVIFLEIHKYLTKSEK